VDPVGLGHEILEPGPALAERPAAHVAALDVHQIEHNHHRRGGHLGGLLMAQPVEARAELGIEDRELAVEHQRRHAEALDRRDEVGITSRVVD
jgi:hypothetical protein